MSIEELGNGQSPKLPAAILQAAAARDSRIALVVGAGCSRATPTSLPMAKECSEKAHAALVADGILKAGECPDPSDLSVLAETVFEKFSSQAEVVQRLPRDKFRRASANPGYLVVAALLRENAISSVLTLNYDLAIEDALTKLCALSVQHIAGPGHVADMGSHNVVYIHRNVNESDYDKWILRASALAQEWKNGWEELMAQYTLTAPVVIFAGLGSPAQVLIETTSRIRTALSGLTFFQVDPGGHAANAFAEALGIAESEYIQLGWNEFALLLAQRVVHACLTEMQQVCTTQITREHFAVGNVSSVIAELSKLDIIELGALRASWLLSETETYTPHSALTSEILSDLLISATAMISKIGDAEVYVEEGIVEFRKPGGGALAVAMFASGKGQMSWTTVEEKLRARRTGLKTRAALPTFAVVSGATGTPIDALVTPQDVLGEPLPKDDIRTGIPSFSLIEARAINLNPAVLDTVL